MSELCVVPMDDTHCKASQKRLERPMGPLETMYHIYHKREMDIYAQIIHLSMQLPVSHQQIRNALGCLVKKHPLLRMTIHESKTGPSPSFRFVEMDPVDIDLREIHCDNLENLLANELNNTLCINEGPLWRFTIIKQRSETKRCSSNLKHDLTFMFKCHHSLADGIYLHQLYSDFIEYLDLTQRGHNIFDEIEELMFLPPIEKLLPLIFAPKLRRGGSLKSKNVSSELEFRNAVHALPAYNNCFSSEIEHLNKDITSTKVVRLNMLQNSTAGFLLSCKRHRSSVTGACIAGSCLSMADILKQSISPTVETLIIPVEIMVNLRRYMTDKTLFDTYPGVAAIHIPLNVRIPIKENLASEQLFWELSRKISENIEDLISSGKPLEVMAEESQSCDQETLVGKSPYVICFTNLSRVDDVLKDSLKDRFKIERFPGITKVTVNDMPIFFIGAFTLNKQFEIGVEYCTSYTSENTAAKFSWNLRSKLQRFPKL